jgi:hypothetical protein
MLAIHQSTLNEYLTCPFMCFKKWGNIGTEEKKGEVNKYAACGTLVHKIAQIYDWCRMRHIALTYNQLGILYAKHFNAIPKTLFYEDEIETFESNYWAYFRRLHEHFLLQSSVPIAVEKTFKVPLFDYIGQGTIDRIDPGHHIIDYKTNGVPYTYESLETNIQAWIYSYAYKILYKKFPKTFTFLFPKAKSANIIRRTIDITPKFISEGEKRISGIWNNIRAEKFDPDPKNVRYCMNYCEYFGECLIYEFDGKQYGINQNRNKDS